MPGTSTSTRSPTDGYARTLFYKNTEGFEVGPISRDKRYIALVRPRTTSDADIFVHDRSTNTTKNITEHTGTVNNSPADFSPDGTKLLFVSDSGGEFAALRSYDLATGAKTTVYEQPWDVLGAEYSKGGKYLTVYVNEDSRYVARVLDPATFTAVSLREMPTGVVRGVSISPNDASLAFYASDGSVPDELYVRSFAGAPTRLTNALHTAIRREDLVVPTVVRFKSYDGVEVPRPALPASSDVIRREGAGDRQGTRWAGRSGSGRLQRAHAGARQPRLRRLRHQQPRSSGYGKTFYAMDDRKHGEADLGDVVASKAHAGRHRVRRFDEDRHPRRELRRIHGARRAHAAAGRVQGRRRPLRHLQLDADAQQHSALVGLVPRGAVRRDGRSESRQRAAAQDLAAVQCRQDQGAAARPSGCERSAGA